MPSFIQPMPTPDDEDLDSSIDAQMLAELDEMHCAEDGSAHGDFPEQTHLASLAHQGDAQGLALAMAQKPDANPALAVAWAAWSGHVDCLEIALSAFYPQEIHPYALTRAAMGGHASCLKLLTRRFHSEDQIDALRQAAEHGRLECARILLDTGFCPPQSPHTNHFQGIGRRSALDVAAGSPHGGATAVMELMLSRIDAGQYPRLREFGPTLARAAEGGNMAHLTRVAILLPRCSEPEKLEAMRQALLTGSMECAHLILESTSLAAMDPRGNNALLIAAQAIHALDRLDEDGDDEVGSQEERLGMDSLEAYEDFAMRCIGLGGRMPPKTDTDPNSLWWKSTQGLAQIVQKLDAAVERAELAQACRSAGAGPKKTL